MELTFYSCGVRVNRRIPYTYMRTIHVYTQVWLTKRGIRHMGEIATQLYVPVFIYMIAQISHKHKKIIYVTANGYVYSIYRVLTAVIPCKISYPISYAQRPFQALSAYYW